MNSWKMEAKKPPPPLTWNVRCKIALGIAQGQVYCITIYP